MFVHLTLVPYIAAAGEVKTKPTQHSVRELMEIGIQPDFLICRTERPLHGRREAQDRALLQRRLRRGDREPRRADDLRDPARRSRQQGFADRVMERLRLTAPTPDLSAWRAMVQRVVRPREQRVRICVVGKYTDYVDSYKSVQEALIHGGIANDVGVDSRGRRATRSRHRSGRARSSPSFHGLLVPGGFGVRGVDGMVEAIRAARETRAAVLRHLPRHAGRDHRVRAQRRADSTDSHSSEFAPECSNPVIVAAWIRSATSPTWAARCDSARIRAVCSVVRRPPRSTAAGSERASSPSLRSVQPLPRNVRRAWPAPQRTVAGQLARGDDRVAGSHPWFIGCQFHPELQSRPTASASAVRRFRGRGRSRAPCERRARSDARSRRWRRRAHATP